MQIVFFLEISKVSCHSEFIYFQTINQENKHKIELNYFSIYAQSPAAPCSLLGIFASIAAATASVPGG